ncbi:AraC family transcriptional regulator [Bacillus mesophilus]|uniref:AraC family transcriptional regulator n=1 Tax=Bacillus mesophilus TaxID=1808955 RepID=A0A6M0QB03_9BACI|nr:AraC family transcriptional regulator [Bacillus mesophilus]MBM7662894.1 AraC family transcriptional regulator [Bacillus mesophilus]NEY73483.1 AraC family transcriptional regulator [Bacillus mesophilus]
MDYVASISQTLDYIEKNLQETMTLEDLAEIACFSPYHYHRVFQTLVGVSVMEYVRKRRLTLAAELLYYSDEKVIDIAMEVGFQYHESFNRAFKKFYGVSPNQYRTANSLSGPLLGKAFLKKVIVQGGQILEPKFITKPEFYVIGYELNTKNIDGQNNKDIPEFWQLYLQKKLYENIPNPLNCKEELGICTDFSTETGEFVYVIGVEVPEGTLAPEGLVYRTFSEMEYVVFTTPASDDSTFTSSIQSTWNYIFTEWFPKSGYEHAGFLDFELYDERCHGKENKVIDIYIPVKKVTA